MDMATKEIIRQGRKKILDDLENKYTQTVTQITATQNAADRLTLQNQLKQIALEMQQEEARLKASHRHTRDAQFKKELHKIDFTDALECVKTTLQSFGSAGGAALFLLEKSYEMVGECCVDRIRELLKAETRVESFREYPVEFAIGMSLDEYGLFQRLGEYVGIALDGADLADYAQAIIHKLCAPLQTGSVVFLLFNKWDLLDSQERVLSRFLDLFWKPLISQFPLCQKRRIKLVSIIITSDLPLAPSCHEIHCCCPQSAFTVETGQSLPLRHWTYDEIQTWIDLYSGTTWGADQIDRFAQHLYRSYKGAPRYTYDKLLKQFNPTQEV